ncbi:MAG: hypothetical protein GY794_18795 [bacterium]|nr:hypothetical protein [bacterium]
MLYDQMRRNRMASRFAGVVVLVSGMWLLSGCEVMRGVGKVTVGGLETAGRATVGGLQWVADGGTTGIRGRRHGATDKPFFLVTGLRFPGIKLEDLSILSIEAVDGKGAPLLCRQGAMADSKYGPAMTITVIPAGNTRIVDVTGVLIYSGGRWTLSARCVRAAGESGQQASLPWTTELLDVVRQ